MSENIKDAIQYGVELSQGQQVVHVIDGKTFYDRTKADLKEVEPIKYAATLTINSLTGLINYLKSKFDEEADAVQEEILLHVESPTSVIAYSKLNSDRCRESLVEAKMRMDKFNYGYFMDSEQFIINIQSLFQREKDAEAVLKCASGIRIEGGGDLYDNGISQQVSVKQGAATIQKAEVPSPATLKPYRTFLEIDQPEGQFIFRINKHGECALFEADGGIWKNHAIDQIKEYLTSALKDEVGSGQITIIG
ncbi:hypothetical protein [Enterococcus wangshanyuanii]|uniref:Phage protein n=1 Tax=Enterococcus wangshanyuanii TaxID=2005703 RepID=A0ABQ1P138_9ENTE|nr:hypothetical protein [Enterococcus wangshanyuanii]GGC88247.1 hypothetical protein GCM10011573_17320 [Enterococcus wangshanyuanii]